MASEFIDGDGYGWGGNGAYETPETPKLSIHEEKVNSLRKLKEKLQASVTIDIRAKYLTNEQILKYSNDIAYYHNEIKAVIDRHPEYFI